MQERNIIKICYKWDENVKSTQNLNNKLLIEKLAVEWSGAESKHKFDLLEILEIEIIHAIDLKYQDDQFPRN